MLLRYSRTALLAAGFFAYAQAFFHYSRRSEAPAIIPDQVKGKTKRPERIADHLPYDAYDWDHVTIAVTCENQWAADKRLPIYLALPLRHHSVMIEPMLSAVNLRRYFHDYTGIIESVSVGGESGPDARPCDYSWVLDMHVQCVENGVAFSYHQTGARLIKNGKEYSIPRELQHDQARKAGLDFDGVNFPQCCC